MTLLDLFSALLILTGLFFFSAGTVGMLRFPDTFSRLHAVTKADNVGLGFVVSGLVLQAANPWIGAKLILVWVFVLMNSSASCFLIASHLFREKGKDGGS